jgi:hypothetical protein
MQQKIQILPLTYNLKLSQFRNSVKYYTLTQSGVDDNSGNTSIPGLNLSSQSWNSNLNKTIRKKVSHWWDSRIIL